MNSPPFNGLYIGQSDRAAAAVAAWKKANPPPPVTLSMVADHIEHIAQVAGKDQVGIGSDFDGVGSVLPHGLEDVSSCLALLAELMRRGWTDQDVGMLTGGNVLRVMGQAEQVSRKLTTASSRPGRRCVTSSVSATALFPIAPSAEANKPNAHRHPKRDQEQRISSWSHSPSVTELTSAGHGRTRRARAVVQASELF